MALLITRSLRGHYKPILQVCHYEVITNHFVMALCNDYEVVTSGHSLALRIMRSLRDHYKQNFSGYEVITSKPITSRHYEYFSCNEPRYEARIRAVCVYGGMSLGALRSLLGG